MPAYTITPQDLLFFRDGRSMETSGGHGARWPEPSVIFDALHAALHRAFPADEPTAFQSWEHAHRFGRSSDRDPNRERTLRFGSLATAGPFPQPRFDSQRAETTPPQWLFPCPLDVTTPDRLAPTLLPMECPGGQCDLPPPLCYSLASLAGPSKSDPHSWWTKQAIEAYLRGGQNSPARRCAYEDDDLFVSEWHTGIAIDPDTQTTGHGDAEGKIYAAHYLRLRDRVALGIHATMPMKNGQPHRCEERLTELFPVNRLLIIGGQQRACQVEELKHAHGSVALDSLLPVSQRVTNDRVKWLLLSPAVFPRITGDQTRISAHPGGWLPNWIAPTDGFRACQAEKIVEVQSGQVLLKGEPRRGPGESREAWRQRVRKAPFLDCRLVAARIPKPIVLTGWTKAVHLKDTPLKREHGPRATLLAVPAGAVYYFEGKDADRLADVLSWHGPSGQPDFGTTIKNRRSTLMGEKGFGLGVCGTWDFFPRTEDA